MFPLIIWLLKRTNSKLVLVLLICGTYLLAIIGQFSGRVFDNSIINNIMKTFTFVPLFLGGALLAKYRIKILALLKGLALPIRFLLLMVGLLLYNIRFSIPIPPLDTYIKTTGHNILVDSLSGAGCIIIILCVLTSSHLSRILSFNIISYFGNISFSFYLIHFPILLVISSIVFPYTNSILLTLLSSFCLTLVGSHIFYKYIELPFQNIGRNLSKLTGK